MGKTEKNKLSGKYILALVVTAAILIGVAFAVLALRYLDNFGEALIEENSNYLAEITEHITVNVESNISNMQKAMETVGLTITSGKQDDKNKIYLNSIREKYHFEYVGIALSDGTLRSTMESEEKDISGEAYYQKAMQGESVVEYVPMKIFKDKAASGILTAVPVYNLDLDSEHPLGVLVAMLDMQKFADSLYIAGYNGQGTTYIIDSSGNILLQTANLDSGSFFTLLTNAAFEDGYSLNRLKADLKAQLPGFCVYSNFGVDKFMHYRSLGIEDWSVVSTVEKGIITEKTTRLTGQLLVLGIGIIVLFLLLFFLALSSVIVSRVNLQATQAKSAFLANMSHEIRTPMNAIVGIGEILLRGNISEEEKKQVMGIVNAGNSLLTIINDILDISKMESGKFSIAEEEYELESLIYDVAAVISVRLNDKPVKFLVDVDPELPKYLTGDMIRVKQVLTNIIGNAVKFTHSGYIKMGIYGKSEDGQVILTIPVEDTGIGIKKEDFDKLFASFSQVDTHRNRNIEGTGLGLAISKQLCEMMGGSITVESTFGAGSTFTIRIRQRAAKSERMIQPFSNDGLKLLVLESSEIMRAHFAVCMDRLHLSYRLCENYNNFSEEAQQGSYTHALANRESFKHLAEESADLLTIIPIALVSVSEQTKVQDYGHTIIGPLFTLQLAAILGDLPVQSVLLRRGGIDLLSIQPLPFVRVLLVDDNEVNLQVAEGLMKPYYMQVDCALSGKDALLMMNEKDYDLIFMDHMMPEMDGIEAVKLIRALNCSKRATPVIALTANVTRGAQELFLQAGFNDFLSKPIDTVRLNTLLNKWLKNLNEAREKENPTKTNEFYKAFLENGHGEADKKVVKGSERCLYVDFITGIDRLGSEKVYTAILATYSRSAHEKLLDLPVLLETDLDTFVIEAHGLKGASGGVCAVAAEKGAAALEHMGKEKKLEEIRAYMPEFLTILSDTLDEVNAYIKRNEGTGDAAASEECKKKEGTFSHDELLAFKNAFWNFESDTIKELLAAHDGFRYEEQEQKLLDELKKSFDTYEFEIPIQMIEAYEQKIQEGN